MNFNLFSDFFSLMFVCKMYLICLVVWKICFLTLFKN